jgi:hypothetical protein
MKITEAIRAIMKDTKTTQKKLVETINSNSGQITVKSQSVIAERLRKDNIGVDKLYEMLEAMDYEIVLQPKSTRGKRPIGAYVIDNKESEEE